MGIAHSATARAILQKFSAVLQNVTKLDVTWIILGSLVHLAYAANLQQYSVERPDVMMVVLSITVPIPVHPASATTLLQCNVARQIAIRVVS
ncbi:hypothetical protein AVEN_160804-1 [Araneus ventricosus]|uniref:Uncharacterized protein n=1 Tax=Araneus ventricosus TaxID=182803 RepID=A0A4Y2DTL0_ARAVE|nr:hypothetical protein AVEN_27918-1 [Araneus ventricosus]GBM20333.1 hypothetical protein AVEN_160804-1 [Araneus ventricosus]